MAKPASKKKEQQIAMHMSSIRQKLANNGPARQDIERRAYELYLGRGGADGYAIEDWQQAERELQARQQ
ncbi:MAG: DUF2934 domain-containing protein [Nitrospira sp.]|nr:DUF2934 domain-containing protein [Nitrospira sp.]